MRRLSSLWLLGALALAGCGGAVPVGPTALPSAAPTPAPAPTPPPATVRVADLFGVNDHFTRGTARLILTETSQRLELGEDFATNGSRTVDIYLTRGADRPRGDDLIAGTLTSRSGAHSFDLGTADVKGYTHVLVWCRPFRIAIGMGELAAAP